MENQHKKIKGYRDLTQEEIDLMNKVKEHGEQLGALIDELRAQNTATGGHSIDIKWVEEAEMELKKGIMCLVRSVAMPESF